MRLRIVRIDARRLARAAPRLRRTGTGARPARRPRGSPAPTSRSISRTRAAAASTAAGPPLSYASAHAQRGLFDRSRPHRRQPIERLARAGEVLFLERALGGQSAARPDGRARACARASSAASPASGRRSRPAPSARATPTMRGTQRGIELEGLPVAVERVARLMALEEQVAPLGLDVGARHARRPG